MPALEYPADVVRYILEHVYGETDPDAYEPESWVETRGQQAAAGIVWSVRFLPTPFTQFCALVAQQSNADLYQSAGLWVYRWRTRRPAGATFTTARNVTAPLSFGRQPVRTALAARLGVSWDLEHATGQFRQSEVYVSALVNRLQPAQLGRRVTTDEPIDLPLPYILAPGAARYLGRTALTRVEQQRWTVTVTSDWDALPIEKGDTILVESPILVASLGTALGTFLVTAKRYDPATDAIVLEAEEAPTAVLTRSLNFAVRASTRISRPLTFAVQSVLQRPLHFALSTGFGPNTFTRDLSFAIAGATQPGLIWRSLIFAIYTAPPPLILLATPGSLALTGRPAIVSRTRPALAASSGAVSLTGMAATLTVSAAPPRFVNATSAHFASSTAATPIVVTPGTAGVRLVVRWATTSGLASALPTAMGAVPTGGGTTINLTEMLATQNDGTVNTRFGMWWAVVTPGQEYTITPTWSGANSRVCLTASAYTAIGSLGTPAFLAQGPGNPSQTIQTGGGPALVIDMIVRNAALTMNPNAGQTGETATVDEAGVLRLRGSYKTGVGAVTMGWSTANGAGALYGVALLPP